VDIERHSRESSTEQKISLVFYSKLKSSWGKNVNVETCTQRLEEVQDGGKWTSEN
jgi:hypothetical protein